MVKLVIPIFRCRVSPVFDACKSALLISVDKNQVVEKREIFLDDFSLNERVELLHRAGITTIICGGISETFYNMFSRESIKIISGIVGAVDEVIGAFIHGHLDDPSFSYTRIRFKFFDPQQEGGKGDTLTYFHTSC